MAKDNYHYSTRENIRVWMLAHMENQTPRLSIAAYARKLGENRQTISAVLSGTMAPSLKLIEKLGFEMVFRKKIE